jgi:signal transduction histidine kinase
MTPADPSLTAAASDLRMRARFGALRRRALQDMGRSAARWRLTWLVPYKVIVVTLLIAYGEAKWRVIVQCGVVAVISVLLLGTTFWRHKHLQAAAFICGVIGFFVIIGTTGGLASPLLVTGGLSMAAMAITVREPEWIRHATFGVFLISFMALAIVARTAFGAMPVPLAPSGPWPSPVYISIALTSAVFSMAGIYRVACAVTQAYERAALELAERREELCCEGEERSRALEAMAARFAHEVKNPLAAIKGLSAHMARHAVEPKMADRLGIVAAEADRLHAIVDEFLSFSRGFDDLSPSPISPHAVARELGTLLEIRAGDAGVSLEVSGEAEIMVDADVRKLRQALLNLVLNAIQASPHGSSVRVSVAGEPGGVRIVVHDDGEGMAPEVLERIRKPYFTTKVGGTGLGVAVARGIIEQHGGRLEYSSAVGRGTSVTVYLPKQPKACCRLPNPLRRAAPSNSDVDAPASVAAPVR